ncbi:MAG TPA: dipeptide epimerase [Polyangiales bacterium]|nr:dipeptide epimerase [Polyangiales bacterium]
MRIRDIQASPLSVPLREPFVIASARMDATRAVLVEVELADEHTGRSARGVGEAACLPPVTQADQPDVLLTIETAAGALTGRACEQLEALAELLPTEPVARAGLECALLDAWARLEGVSLCRLLGGEPRALLSDITLPICEPSRMAELASQYRDQGFRHFKVKVGKSLDDDIRALRAVHARVPDALYRLDANAGFSASQALTLVQQAHSAGLALECFEQPCARDDLEGMAEVAREGGVPVIADESVRDLADLARVSAARAAHGVNLKLAKSGGMLAALAIGRRARASGLQVMCGGMVETRLGMTAMAHVACALDAVEYVDLDTAFLLAEDPFEGGYDARGPELQLRAGAGLGVAKRTLTRPR